MKIAIAYFTYGDVVDRCAASLRNELNYAFGTNERIWLAPVGGDALISRSRSKAMSDFLRSDCDVLFMLDHDIEFTIESTFMTDEPTHGPGAIIETCRRALERDAIVGGLYSLRSKGAGMASRPWLEKLTDPFDVILASDQFLKAEFVASGFVAYPRSVIEETLKYGQRAGKVLDVVDSASPETYPDFDTKPMREVANAAISQCVYSDGTPMFDFFRPVTVPERLNPSTNSYLSEDYAFCWRARQANPKRDQWLWAKPWLTHWGRYGYTMSEASQQVEQTRMRPAPRRLIRP